MEIVSYRKSNAKLESAGLTVNVEACWYRELCTVAVVRC